MVCQETQMYFSFELSRVDLLHDKNLCAQLKIVLYVFHTTLIRLKNKKARIIGIICACNI